MNDFYAPVILTDSSVHFVWLENEVRLFHQPLNEHVRMETYTK